VHHVARLIENLFVA